MSLCMCVCVCVCVKRVKHRKELQRRVVRENIPYYLLLHSLFIFKPFYVIFPLLYANK